MAAPTVYKFARRERSRDPVSRDLAEFYVWTYKIQPGGRTLELRRKVATFWGSDGHVLPAGEFCIPHHSWLCQARSAR